MPLDDFLDISPNHFFHKLSGFIELRNQDTQLAWEIARRQTAETISVWVSKPIEPEMLWQFPWDEDHTQTEEEVQAALEEYKKRYGTTLKQNG